MQFLQGTIGPTVFLTLHLNFYVPFEVTSFRELKYSPAMKLDAPISKKQFFGLKFSFELKKMYFFNTEIN